MTSMKHPAFQQVAADLVTRRPVLVINHNKTGDAERKAVRNFHGRIKMGRILVLWCKFEPR
jgi:hypothetical protein